MNDGPGRSPLSFGELMPTGISGLDQVLKGGFTCGSLVIINGGPGTGKTVFGNQLCFNQARMSEQSAIYVVFLSESKDQMIQYVSRFSFFNAAQVGRKVVYLDSSSVLENEGLDGLLHLLQETVIRMNASILILDGIASLEDRADNPGDFKKFVHSLHIFGPMSGCTTFLLRSKLNRNIYPEDAIADSIISFNNVTKSAAMLRRMEVGKLRGSSYLSGKHFLEIGGEGMHVYPRIEELYAHPAESTDDISTRLRFGIPKLDDMTNGGIFRGSATTILGAPGTGKTLLGLHFLEEGAQQGEPGVYFGCYEPPQRLLAKAGNIGIRVEEYQARGLLHFLWQPALQRKNIDAIAEQLLHHVQAVKAKRVFIDGIEVFKSGALHPSRVGTFLSALTNRLRSLGVTSIFSEETPLFTREIEMPVQDLAAVLENIIYLRFVEMGAQLRRLIAILKMRESGYNPLFHELDISDQGMAIHDAFREVTSVLTGVARPANPSMLHPSTKDE